MKTTTTSLLLLAASALIAGCAHTGGLVTAKVRIQAGTNVVEIRQPKDTIIRKLSYDPKTGALMIEGYASAANAGAIETARAQAEAQERLFTRGVELGGQLGATAASAYGIKMPQGQNLTPTGEAWRSSPPAGWKWIIGAGGVPMLAPVDDPSRPVLLYPTKPVDLPQGPTTTTNNN